MAVFQDGPPDHARMGVQPGVRLAHLIDQLIEIGNGIVETIHQGRRPCRLAVSAVVDRVSGATMLDQIFADAFIASSVLAQTMGDDDGGNDFFACR